jgi:leucyl aminopeptidase (aminopeptidase T)
MGYELAEGYLERYADLLVNFALGGGKGIERGDVVLVRAPDSAKPLYAEVCRAVWRAGGNLIADYVTDDDQESNLTRDFYELAGEEQLAFFADKYWRGLIDQIDHLLYLRAVADPHALRDVEPAKIFTHQRAHAPLIRWQTAKESEGRLTWTIGAYATEATAAEAELSLEEYWDQIIKACFLDQTDPKASPARRGRRRRPLDHARRAATLDRRRRAQHPQLRGFHQPGLARHRGLDPLQRATVRARHADQGSGARLPRGRDHARHGGAERGAARGDARDQEREPCG